ncbi:hypothetical protein LEWO105114_04875 [Legionella worsleiensis]|uniref:Coiled-coil protein n=2 Tax=Legionella worsleiensis TaxID=45076 RepID=A0A0W1AJR0_9GAMM|nr:hypothetical protein Lwor_0560 [Legionella worsleiensis]STY32081.1 Uncharacterised protein [Legionella worsleiensis]
MPVILRLRSIVPDLPQMAEGNSLQWSFDKRIKLLGSDFYKKIVLHHPVLNMEYSILCHQIRHHFDHPKQINAKQVIGELQTALMLAQLLEEIYLNYLVVPREVERLRRHQQIYKALLEDMAGMTFLPEERIKNPEQPEFSFAQYIRDNTAQLNWLRLFLTRTKRFLNFLNLVVTGSPQYKEFVRLMDFYTNPFFDYIAWCFFIPRLTTNLFLLAKHSIAWSDVNALEQELDWHIRFQAQIQRRWFELGNDLVWVGVGLLNCFVLVGALAPLSFYFTMIAFAFDVANASLRMFIELNRLYGVQNDYKKIYLACDDDVTKNAIEEYQHFLKHRIEFETLRLGLVLAGTVAVFWAMCLALPFLAANAVIPFIGAVSLIAIWMASFALTRNLEQFRPNDTVEKPSGVTRFGVFAKNNNDQVKGDTVLENTADLPSDDRTSLRYG